MGVLSRSLHRAGLSALLGGLVALSSLATVPIAQANSDTLDQYQLDASSQLPDGVFSGGMEAQTFVAGQTGPIDRVFVYVSGNGSSTLDVAVEPIAPITNFDGTFEAPTGVVLGSGTVVRRPRRAGLR